MMNFKHVLIVTYGRSGSTLLQGLLNSIDGCVVKGENYNACYGLFKSFQSFKKTKNEFGVGESSLAPTSPWFGASDINLKQFMMDARSLLLSQLSPSNDETTRCVGFKEIRYFSEEIGRKENQDLHAFLDFMTELLPDCALVFLTRNHEQVANSAWWKTKNSKALKSMLFSFEESLKSYAEGKSWVFSIDYSDMTNRTQRIMELYEFIGAEYQQSQVESVLSTRHSYAPKEVQSGSYTGCSIDVTDFDAVEYVSIDSLNTGGINKIDGSLPLRGVVVLKPDVKENYSLLVKNGKHEFVAEWGISSPLMAQMYPDNYHANNARFRFLDASLSEGETATIYLVDSNNRRIHLAKVEMLSF